jgi:hypothetical protein
VIFSISEPQDTVVSFPEETLIVTRVEVPSPVVVEWFVTVKVEPSCVTAPLLVMMDVIEEDETTDGVIVLAR